MRPVLFTLGEQQFDSYSVFIALAVAVSAFLVMRSAELQMRPHQTVVLAKIVIGSVCAGFVGAYFWSREIDQTDGLTFYGGALAGIAAVLLLSAHEKLAHNQLLDLLTPPFALAHALGRMGCYFAGCCYGSRNPPVQLIESAGELALFFFLIRMASRKRRHGQIWRTWLLGYGILRACLESLRTDDARGFLTADISVSRALAIATVLWVILDQLLFARFSKRRAG